MDLLIYGTETIRKAYGGDGYETILKKHINIFKIDGLTLENLKISLGEMIMVLN